jgi:long-chain acyl-CoA synthetase
MNEVPWRSHYAHPTPWDQQFSPLSLPEMLRRTATLVPDAPLIDFYGRRYSYAAVDDAADRFARGLMDMGIKAGDRVGLYLPNVPHYLAAYYGALRLGAIVVNFSPLYTVEELRHQVEDSGTRVLVTLDAAQLLPTALQVLDTSSLERLVVGSVAGVLPRAKSLLFTLFRRGEIAPRPDDPRITAFSAVIRNSGDCPVVSIDPENAIALIQYTGGTTGTPKGAMLTHQNLTANARQTAAIDPHVADGDRIIGVLPLFHVFANSCVLNRTVWIGGMIVLLPRFDARQVLKAVGRTRATSLPGVPTMYQALLDCPDIARTDFTTLRVCVSGGAPMPAELRTRFEGVTGARVTEGYGLTEAPVVSVNPYEGDNRGGSIGQPVPGTLIRLVDRDDPTRPPPEGEPGEITVSGPQVMKGYWRRPDKDAEIFIDGCLRTGDVGLMDAQGYVRIVDRLKDMIAVGGFKVFPSQVEAVLYRHPAVREALVIGVPDHYHGEMPKAFVTLVDDADVDGAALLAWLNPQLGKHERCIAVEVRDELPKTMIGKLSRKELVAEEAAKAAAGDLAGALPA